MVTDIYAVGVVKMGIHKEGGVRDLTLTAYTALCRSSSCWTKFVGVHDTSGIDRYRHMGVGEVLALIT